MFSLKIKIILGIQNSSMGSQNISQLFAVMPSYRTRKKDYLMIKIKSIFIL